MTARTPAAIRDLTPRQRDVLGRIAEGRTNYEIAQELGLSLEGVKYHVSEILARLDVATREEAVEAWRARRGVRQRLQRPFEGWPNPDRVVPWIVLTVLAGAAATVALVILLLLGSDDAAPATSGPGRLDAASAPAPPCLPGDITIDTRVAPWFGGNLITIDVANRGAPCDAGGLGRVSIDPAPPGNASLDFPAGILPSGPLRTIQLLWQANCDDVGKQYAVDVAIAGRQFVVPDVGAIGCISSTHEALFLASELDFAAGAPPALPTCAASTLALDFDAETTASAIVFTPRITSSGPPCRLRGTLSVEVIDAASQRAPVFANPDSIGVFGDLDGELAGTAFAWENWCGAPGTFSVNFRFGGLLTSHPLESPPCADATQQSQLRSTQGASVFSSLSALVGVDIPSLPAGARAAAEYALAPGHGFSAIVTSVTHESYRDLMCGRQPYRVDDQPVWAVTLLIVARGVSSVPSGTTPVDPATLPHTMLYVVDESGSTSLQTFSPWPLARTPGSVC